MPPSGESAEFAAHERGPKAGTFIAHDFATDARVVHQTSLRVQGRVNVVTQSVETEYGARYTV